MILRFVTLSLTILGLTSLSPLAHGREHSPYEDQGDHLLPTARATIKSQPKTGLDHDLEIWTPTKPGSYPVFFFQTGLNGAAPPQAYDETFHRLAKRGVIVIAPVVVFTPIGDELKVGMKFVKSNYWMARHLAQSLPKAQPLASGVLPDFSHFLIGAHSSAVKSILELYRSIHERVAGLVLIEPVNVDPYKMTSPAIADDEYFDHGTPVLFIAAGLGSVPGRDMGERWPACAPREISSEYFFNHFNGPRWLVEATEYGHADMLGGIYYQALKTISFCKVAVDMDPDKFRLFVSGAIAAFAHGTAKEDPGILKYIEDPSLSPVKTQIKVSKVDL